MDEPQEFKNRKEAAAWLSQKGWKVSRSTFYKHCSEGRIRPNTAGGFDRSTVLRYARLHLAQIDQFQSLEASELAEKKIKAEVAKLEEQSKFAKLKREQLEGTLIPRAEVELQLAGRAAALDAALKYSLTLQAPAVIETVDGKHARQQDLIRLLHEAVNSALNEYAAPVDIEVNFTALEEQKEAGQ
jgi:hypothetical protein